MGKINELCNIFRRTNKIKGGEDSQPLPQNTKTQMKHIKTRISYIRLLAKNKKYKSYSDMINEVLDDCERQLKTITGLNPETDIEGIIKYVQGKLDGLDKDLGNAIMPR